MSWTDDRGNVAIVFALVAPALLGAAGGAVDFQSLRLQRAGSVFTMSWRPVTGGLWNVVASHVRLDLPPTLEVGPMAYSNGSPALIVAEFADVTFAP